MESRYSAPLSRIQWDNFTLLVSAGSATVTSTALQRDVSMQVWLCQARRTGTSSPLGQMFDH
eukprot:scaffold435208_cov14-Prasinocladus_malaysianus.AAC.1